MVWSWRARRLAAASGMVLGILVLGCSTLRQMQEKQQPFVAAQLAADAADVYAAALSVLAEFDLLVTARYDDQRFFEARGDWETEHEGAVVHVSVQALGPASSLRVDAGPSGFDGVERKRKLAEAILARITELLEVEAESP
jgi:hypothetical protein